MPALLCAGLAAVGVVLLGWPAYDPASPLVEYALRAGVVAVAAATVGAWWWSRGHRWAVAASPAVVGAIGAGTLVVALNRTPYAPGGLDADQSFRTAAITRFADSPGNADFTFPGLPSFYAPAYFWVLGRAADLTGVPAWQFTKVGTVVVALLVPVVTFLLWRRIVPEGPAALIAVGPLLVADFYQPYAWLVLFAIVPWWLEAVGGLRRARRRPGNPVLLGVVGGLLFMTYYYFFFIAALVLAGQIVVAVVRRRWEWARVRRVALVLAVAAAVAAVYWLPLAISILRAGSPQTLANRWFSASHPELPLPMTEPSLVGALAVAGLIYLVWTARAERLSRWLLGFLAAAYGWYLLGAVAAALDSPLLSFRGKPLIPMILLIGAALGLTRLAQLAAARFAPTDVYRVAGALGLVVLVFAGQSYVSLLRDSPQVERAHATAWPDGHLPRYHPAGAAAPDPPVAALHEAIEARYPGPGQPVLLTGRADLLAIYPYWGFLQWNAHYAHPAGEFDARVALLSELMMLGEPAEFARRSGSNPFDRIDVVVLPLEGDDLVLRFAQDAFPAGVQTAVLRFPQGLFAEFETVRVGAYVVAVRR